MASRTTTHVLEIETGIGEPAFIPLCTGNELQPISVGKKGMWRIESPRVLDVHAFVYFDGSSLFVQSADETNAASVEGVRVGKAWTELHAPCTIEVGMARLRFRSLIADDNQATQMGTTPLVAPGDPAGPPRSRPVASAADPPPATDPRRSTGQPARASAQPPSAESPPIAFPKVDRPFKPGELAPSPQIDESTRIAPLESTAARRSASPPGQAAAESPEDGAGGPDTRRIRGAADAAPAMQHGQYVGTGTMVLQGPMAASTQPVGFGHQPSYPPNPPPPYHLNAQHQGYHPNPPMYGQQPYPNAGGSGSIGPRGMAGPVMTQGPAHGSTAHGGNGSIRRRSILKIGAGLLLIVGGVFYLARNYDLLPKRKPVATLDGAAAGEGSSAPPSAPAAQAAWPPGVPCPPPNWPPGTPPPCTPNGLRQQADPPVKDGGRAGAGPTLERQAVDLVAAGETAKAAEAYEELARRDPHGKVYSEGARILRAKLDAGVP